jgi:guanyl-specific ribonuclease Sa
MGLMDRDYMHEKRSGQSFTPAPEKSAVGTLFMVLVFVAALFLLYKLADWQLARRASDLAAQTAALVQSIPSQPPTRQQASPRSLPLTPGSSTSDRTDREAPLPSAGNHVVTKCIVNGKTSYSDDPCTSGAVMTQVTTRADHNIMKPVRVTATAEAEATFSPAHVEIAQNSAPSDYAAKKSECQWLDTQIKNLDSMSRQPQSGQMMDWIRDERKKARDRQFRIPCE